MNDSASGAVTAELVAEDGTRHALSGEMKVGRSDSCDIAIDDSRVSREHALLRFVDEQLSVADLGSANGTSVNGKAVTAPTPLANGDRLQFEKHSFVVEITGLETAADDDLTVVSAPPEDDLTAVSAPEPEPAPEPAPQAAPGAVPGSWVDDDLGEHTQFIDVADLQPVASTGELERLSDRAHLLVLGPDGKILEASELEPTGSAAPDAWEIGRDGARCQIVLAEPSVGATHAQLVHDGGRWRIVKLPGKNPVVVNGEQRLSAYLSDRDEIRLGKATLIFRAPLGAPAATGSASSPRGTTWLKNWKILAAGALLLVVIATVALF
jgi:pSer/pThr/pTyr-binding forkhead associated (FHA) protein